jgi:hypothetical protein
VAVTKNYLASDTHSRHAGGGELRYFIQSKEIVMNNNLYYIVYSMDNRYCETDSLFTYPQAIIEKSILEDDGAKNVKILKNESVLN